MSSTPSGAARSRATCASAAYSSRFRPSTATGLGFNPNPSPEFTSTPDQIAFTPDGSKLIATTKGDGQSIEAYPVSAFGQSSEPIITADPGQRTVCDHLRPTTS
jgi:hypothetical protein